LLFDLFLSAHFEDHFLGLSEEPLVLTALIRSRGKADLLKDDEGDLEEHLLVTDPNTYLLQGLFFTLHVLHIVKD
jgi:hypothetical protein